jgi:biotin transporter BioY
MKKYPWFFIIGFPLASAIGWLVSWLTNQLPEHTANAICFFTIIAVGLVAIALRRWISN